MIISLINIATKAVSQNTQVSGIVTDSIANLPLKGASVSFNNDKGNSIATVVTNESGVFNTTITSADVKNITVSFVGYKTKVVAVNYAQLTSQKNLGTIYLFEAKSSLAEVVVKGVKPQVNFKIDRQVYKASQFANAQGGNGVDVVRNLPSVSVNGQGEINFRGSNSFLVLVNGKPTQGEPSFVLSQLPAGSIESVEVITSPSAQYDADGKAGIINIITKNGIENGWMVQANVMGGLPPFNDFDNKRQGNPQRYSADVSAAYRINKWDVGIGANYLRNDIVGFREGDVFTIINNTKTSFPSVGERSFKRYNYGARATVNYQANANNNVSAGFYIGKKYQRRVADLLYTNTKLNLVSSNTSTFVYFNENTQDKEGVFTLANIDYSHSFADKSKIFFSALYERAALSSLTTNNNLVYPALTDTIQYTTNPTNNPLNAYRLKVDYNRTIGKGNFSTGYQFRNDKQDGNFLYQTKVIGTTNFITDPLFTSRVNVANQIHAVYVQYASSVNKLNYSTGLRLETTNRELQYSQNNQKDKLSLTNLFPSVQLRYKAALKTTLKAGYSRRIKRTNNYELNPFPEREHSETLEQGDPNLLPELIGNYELGVEQGLKNGNLYFTVYRQQTTNPIQRVNKIFNDTILNRVFTNAGKAVQVGFETNFNYKINKVWQTVIGGNIYKYNIKGSIFNGTTAIQNNSWVFSINSTQSFTLPKNWLLQWSVNYLSLRATAQGEDSYFLTPHVTVKKTTNDKRWSFQAQWLNMDAGLNISNRQRITTKGTNFYTTTNYIYEPDQVQLSISFNLLKKNRKINLPVSEIGEKEF